MNWLQQLAMPDMFHAAFTKKTYASLKSVKMQELASKKVISHLFNSLSETFIYSIFDSEELNQIVMFLLSWFRLASDH